MSLILIATFLTVFLSFSLQTYLIGKQANPILFQSEEFRCGIEYFNGVPEEGPDIVVASLRPVSLPQSLNMGDSRTLNDYEFAIYLNSSTKTHLDFEATAPISFQLMQDPSNDSLGGWEDSGESVQTIVNETQTTHFDSELYLSGSAFYILAFQRIITNSGGTVTLSFQLE